MSRVVRFPPALGAWVRQHLEQGQAPDELVRVMTERKIAAEAARSIVAAFVRSRIEGTPAPVDSVEATLDESAVDANPTDRIEPPRLAPGPVIHVDGRIVRVVARAERPVLAVLAGVLDAAECAELIDRARGRLAPSTLVDPASGRDLVSGQRTSSGMFFRLREDAFIARLDQRLADIMNMPLEHGEGLQVLHYPTGAGSAPHFDFLAPSNAANRASIARSGQRVCTMVTYLNDVPAGGETAFASAGWAITPQRGNAVCFEYCNRFGELDQASVHASRAVESGEKWVATKWLRERPFVSAP